LHLEKKCHKYTGRTVSLAEVQRNNMNTTLTAYGYLTIAIICEVIGTLFLNKSAQFSRLIPTLSMAALYLLAFYFLSLALRDVPLGIAYALWAGLGIVLTAVAGILLFQQKLDTAAIIGISMIVGGVLVMQLFSKVASH